MAQHKTALSVGETLRALLLQDPDVSEQVDVISPVIVAPETKLPYIVYRRSDMEIIPTKSGYRSSDATIIEVSCCAKNYEASLRIAEAVRFALESKVKCPDVVLCPRSIALMGSEETYEGDAYIQILTFKIHI